MTTNTKIDGEKLITKIRSQLLLNNPWFGSLAMRLKPVEDNTQPTCCTDGTEIRYNADWLSNLPIPEQMAVFAHEIMHCALRHMYRRNGRDPKKWNYATDLVINAELIAAGFSLPAGGLIDPQYKGMYAEQVYAMLPDNPEGGYPGPESPTGSFEDAPKPSKGKSDPSGNDDQQGDDEGDQESDQESNTEADWELAVEQATMVARKAGKLPGGVAEQVKQARDKGSNWRDILRRFIEQTIPKDYSWSTPNRRFLSQGVYLPSVVKENAPRLVVAVDTSGSIYGDPELVQQFSDELTTILQDVQPRSIDIIYCDAMVRSTDTFTPDDHEVQVKMVGGGGTRFQPVFDHIADGNDPPPAALIYLTDLEGDNPTDPGYPVLWAVPERTRLIGPFGETVTLSKW